MEISQNFVAFSEYIFLLYFTIFSGEKGNLDVWDITKRRSEPIQTQNISGRAINAICPYRTKVTKGNEGHFISVADDSGTLRLMTLPKHLWQSNEHALDNLQTFIDAEIAKKQEKERLKSDKERTRKMRSKKTIDEELEEDTKVEEPEDEYLQYYFTRSLFFVFNLNLFFCLFFI